MLFLFQAFVYCSYGANNIYYATLITSLFSLLTCIVMGYVAHKVARPKLALPLYVFILVAIAFLVIFSDMREWLYYVIAALLGICTVGLNVQIYSRCHSYIFIVTFVL